LKISQAQVASSSIPKRTTEQAQQASLYISGRNRAPEASKNIKSIGISFCLWKTALSQNGQRIIVTGQYAFAANE
jgi:hypothetical protein